MANDNPRTFISFDFDNNEKEKVLFAGQGSKDSPTPFTISDWSSKETLPQAQWEKLISDKLNKCNLMIVLVGTETHQAKGVIKEISMAAKSNVPFFGVYVGGANEQTALPAGLNRNRTIGWEWKAVASAINQMMSEGKNAGAKK